MSELNIKSDNPSIINETVQKYSVQKAVMYSDFTGIAIAYNEEAVAPYVVWTYRQNKDGSRDYCWGHYYNTKKEAERYYWATYDCNKFKGKLDIAMWGERYED